MIEVDSIEEAEVLTPRQQQVCDLLAHGYTNKEIALMLGHISHRTVEDHREKIMGKLGVKNAVELVLKVHGLGKFKPAGEPHNEQAENSVDA